MLSSSKSEDSVLRTSKLNPEAAEFVPKTPIQGATYADITRGDSNSADDGEADKRLLQLCPYARVSDHCPQADCVYLHGDKCDFCNCLCLHPFNNEQRNTHRDECIREHEKEMEQAFAIQRSTDKACGICMDIILDKELPVERRFGILESCDHIFCLSCIRKWRQTEQLDKKTIRSCPECRVFSSFVIPSQYWYDSGEEKDKLIANYKKALSQKPCKYFKQGQGQCPFAGACFYLHAYPDGRKAEEPPPTLRRRGNHSNNSSIRDVLFWNYFEVRDGHELTTSSLDLLDFFENIEEAFRSQDIFRSSDTEDESDFGSFLDFGDT
ncbi:E3 ubiquitin-protein ligase makorin-1-like [Brevipalpus obovatus]|uniref:E3 ubiquitin-protein ligase makorin-1-like n=1 Tax=Brevipalpus obovatus TaxID=246614 RepID=UPI003D9DF002